ncbi:hypothetical protein SDC9_94153 [bioreactor metagenome]|uniref:AbiEi antitoxin C-terminal domain-containing protein n=1 Tax=bioreactor metagenome TaxID=1076179 RepID=A0A645A9B3_9ZZZZ
MERPNYLEQIKARTDKSEPGTVFIPSDFFDIAEAVKVNVALKRLRDGGELRRVMRGVYAKPKYSELLKTEIPPRSDDIAKAIARNYGWTIVPCGDTALNLLGLSPQVPAVWLYVSDGPYKSYEADEIALKFKHTDNKNEVIGISYQTALIIQALKALGKENVTDKEISELSKALNRSQKQEMLLESRRVTAWVYEYIKQICMVE